MADGNMYTWLLQCKQSGFDMNYINKNSKYSGSAAVQLPLQYINISEGTIVIPLQYNCLYNTQILQKVQLSYNCSTHYLLLRNALGAGNLLAFIEISLIVLRSKNRMIDRSRHEWTTVKFRQFPLTFSIS